MADIHIIWNFTIAERLMQRKGVVFYCYSEYMSQSTGDQLMKSYALCNNTAAFVSAAAGLEKV